MRSLTALRAVTIAVCSTVALGACSSGSSGGKAAAVRAALQSAVQLQDQGRLDQAKTLYEQVLAKDPRNYLALYDLGVIAQTQGDTTEALSRYAASLVIKPDYVAALYNEATIYTQSQPQLAMSLYRKVISLQPIAATAYLNLAFLELSTHNLSGAVHDFAQAVHQQPDLLYRVPKKLTGAVRAQVRHLTPAATTPSSGATSQPTASSTP